MIAIVYEVGNDFKQREVCRLSVQNGAIVLSNEHPLGRFVLNTPVQLPGRTLDKEDGEAFLEALPSVYSGSRFRVGLE